MTKLAKYGVAATLIALVAQAVWESPLVKLVWHVTWLGGRAASGMRLERGWGCDLVAVTINAAVYLTATLALDAVVRRWALTHRDSWREIPMW